MMIAAVFCFLVTAMIGTTIGTVDVKKKKQIRTISTYLAMEVAMAKNGH